ncbi:RNA-binding protein with serine-rich domain 1-A-like [Condylostylus longicornis]|uniref:RNA-binding protein with serine-rich domain 1-A-like n=1 Tax=Condylostylus longicornis TaxID=2530218 RepID=UPI00244E1094|nr:RNA-binding protein with serine-rich domain 1-A-like [Condylostylus longicornis]
MGINEKEQPQRSLSSHEGRGERSLPRRKGNSGSQSRKSSPSKEDRRRGRSTSSVVPRSSPMETEDDTSDRGIVVTNLTRAVTQGHIKEIFALFGTIVDIQLMKDPVKPSRSKVVVLFESAEEASTALRHMDRGQIDGDCIRVSTMKHPEKRPKEPRRSPYRSRSRQMSEDRTSRRRNPGFGTSRRGRRPFRGRYEIPLNPKPPRPKTSTSQNPQL